jgi:Protein of unknown function (DUF1552)
MLRNLCVSLLTISSLAACWSGELYIGRGATAGGTGDPGSDAAAPNEKIPARVIFVTSTFGFWDDAFKLQFGDGSQPPATGITERDLTDSSVVWSRILAPLEGLKEHVTVVSGLAMLTSFDAAASGNDDAKTVLTGQVVAIGGSIGPSLDWLIAQSNVPKGGIPIVVAGTAENTFDSSKVFVRTIREPIEIHSQLFGSGSSGDCTSPEPFAYGDLVAQSNQRYRGWMTRMIPLISDAFRCDKTRVFSLHGPDPSPSELGSGAGSLDLDVNSRVNADPMSVEIMIRYGELYGKQISALAEELKSKTTADGTLLDHTLIVWLPRWAGPGFRRFPWNMVLIGGRSLGVKTGRHLQVAQDATFAPYGNSATTVTTGGAHNWALNSIATLFGVGTGHIGDDSIRLHNGTTIDLRGMVGGLF